MNLLAHVLSVLAFAGLVYWLLENQKKHEFLLYLLRVARKDDAKVRVDWPTKYLQKFSLALRIPIQIEGAVSIPAVRVDGKGLINLHLSHGIKSIRIKPTATGVSEVYLKLSKPLSDLADCQEQLAKAFENKLRFFLEV